MPRAFAAGAGAAFFAFFGFWLTLGGLVIGARYVVRSVDRTIGQTLRTAFTPPRPTP